MESAAIQEQRRLAEASAARGAQTAIVSGSGLSEGADVSASPFAGGGSATGRGRGGDSPAKLIYWLDLLAIDMFAFSDGRIKL